jgi:hypothetical protein
VVGLVDKYFECCVEMCTSSWFGSGLYRVCTGAIDSL